MPTLTSHVAIPRETPVTNSLPSLRVQTLGLFAVWHGDTPLPLSTFAQRKVAHLFKLLLAAPGFRLHREYLADTLWPDTDPAAAAHRLRSTVYRLRQAVGEPYLPSARDLLALVPAPATPDRAPPADWLDALAFEQAAAATLTGHDLDGARAALARYTGDYLLEEPYEDWASTRRTALCALFHQLLLHTAALAAQHGQTADAQRLLMRLLTAEQTHEEAALALMRLLTAQGRQADALRVYDTLATTLTDEIGLDPGPPLQELRAQLLAPPPTGAPTPGGAPAPATAPLPPAAPRIRPPDTAAPPLENLPAPLATIIGRQQELAALRDTLDQTRLLTLTGAGGVGKSRLAIELARSVQPRYPAGAWFVDLAALSDAATLAQQIGETLDVRVASGAPGIAALATAVRARRLLLVLDNCEQVVQECADLVATLLRVAPALHILATSREELGLAGETCWRVPSLDAPSADDEASVAASTAAHLFCARARAVQPDFALTRETTGLVATVCRQLDGLPLALELAAARLTVLTLPQLVERLDDRFRLLSGGSRGALPHQRTLRATLNWSYALLTGAEQALLRRLSVFPGGCTLEAAEAVCAGGAVPSEAVLDLLAGLARKSLVLVRADAATAHYQLSETVRLYAAEALAGAGETQETQQAYARYGRSRIETRMALECAV